MSADLIRVWPAAELRQPFAVWAAGQDPKVRTVSSHEFGVLHRVFTHMPEDLLIGSLINGHPYVPAAAEHDSEGMAAVGTRDGTEPAPETLATGGIVSGTALAWVGERGPEPSIWPSSRGQAPGDVAMAVPADGATLAAALAADIGLGVPAPSDSSAAAPDAAEDSGRAVGAPAGGPSPAGSGNATGPGRAGDQHVCPEAGCGRPFGSSRALKAHRRQAHAEGAADAG